jgi:hypothetical protein
MLEFGRLQCLIIIEGVSYIFATAIHSVVVLGRQRR